jgi:hypothetical protein
MNTKNNTKNNLIIILILVLVLLVLVLFLFYNKLNKLNTKENFIDKDDIKIKLNIQSVLIIKENIPFLREWIIYHINLGFDKIYLYDNTGSIGIDGSTTNNNKYNFNFNEIINLNDSRLEQELNNIINDFKDYIVYLKWQPKDDKGNIIYGQPESIIHYKNNLPKENDNNIITYTAFTDVDEFIFSPSNIDLKKLIKEKYIDGYNRIIIIQKKFYDRFCLGPKKIIDMFDTIEEIDTSEWAFKNIINNDYIDINNISNIHNINITNGKTIKLDEKILRFNHYNINKKQIEWMKTFFNQNNFKSGKDNSMSRYKNIIDNKCSNNCSDKNNFINYNKIDKTLCVPLNTKYKNPS